MKPVMKDIYLNILKYLEPYGYKMYKGKIWRYNPDIGYVIEIVVQPTQWGTLNDIIMAYSTCQEPITFDENRSKKTIAPGTYWEFCLYLQANKDVSVFAMGHPDQSVDVTMWQQYKTLLPYLEKEFFPELMFDDRDIGTYLHHMETISILSCKTYYRTIGVGELELAREYMRFNDVESALRIIALNEQLCDYKIHSYLTAPMNLNTEERREFADRWRNYRNQATELADMIQNRPEELQHLIEENKAISEKTCQGFFTSRYFKAKTTGNLI
ncbi:hypothetical protein JS518_02420 [Clostridiales bacterium FE2010]|nr:hypothetical protein JS518_02420 [Clostridiales bacterium FE2010]